LITIGNSSANSSHRHQRQQRRLPCQTPAAARSGSAELLLEIARAPATRTFATANCRIVYRSDSTLAGLNRKLSMNPFVIERNRLESLNLQRIKSRQRAQPKARRKQPVEVLTEPRFRKRGRRPLRQILYPDPEKTQSQSAGLSIRAAALSGVDRKHRAAGVCPSCQQQALSQALFEGCSCPTKPMVWCTKVACQQARLLLHHSEANCQLRTLHPGGGRNGRARNPAQI
uniref:MYND-type domain-containing protein n=1 Tax=Macrostomum lignano TaxID=282301 RepID=A0A1I8FFY2_9PLAT